MTSYDEDEMDAAEKAMYDRLRGRVTPAMTETREAAEEYRTLGDIRAALAAGRITDTEAALIILAP